MTICGAALVEPTMRSKLWVALLLVVGAGCASGPRQPPGQPPNPSSVTVADPGGDAHDPHRAALERQVREPWGHRNDKDDQVHVPLPDGQHWKRVRFFGVDHFTGFRYGDDHHAVAVLLVRDAPKKDEPPTSDSCLRDFERWARLQVRAYGVRLGPIGRRDSSWREQPLTIGYVDGEVDWAFSKKRFSAAWAAYAAYPAACLVYAMAAKWEEQPELARRVRDRWVQEGFERMAPLTETKPIRK